MSETGRGRPFTQYTAWTPALLTPMRTFLRTETGGAAVLLAAAVASLVWVNAAPSSYDSVWHTDLSIHVGDAGIGQDLRGWVNSGLMTLFFFVVGLEARREFDVGELRERRRVTLPLLAGVAGMAAPVLIYLAINAGHGSSGGWGAAMSTDTAFALGILALVGPRRADRLRVFMLTVVVVDDFVALLVIAVGYTDHLDLPPLLLAVGLFGAVLAVRAAGVRTGVPFALLGVATWVALFESGVDPVVVGLTMGLVTFAYPAAREDPAVRARECRHPDQRRLPGARRHVPDHPGDPGRLRRRQTARHRRHVLARQPAQRGAAAPARRLGSGCRRGQCRGDRVHGSAADLLAGVRGGAAS